MILSFHPCFETDQNLICAGRLPDETDLAAIKASDAVILPQGCSEKLYRMARENCRHVFPHFDAKFDYPGKTGQIRLFQRFKAPHPDSVAFENLDQFNKARRRKGIPLLLQFPFVVKLDWGGEGEGVFLVESEDTLKIVLEKIAAFEASGQKGFLIQKFIACGNRSLRVVVIGARFISYWRVQEEENSFFTHVSKGARIDENADEHLQKAGNAAAGKLCLATGINLAGFDVIFSENEKKDQPLFLEINYFFGRSGLGGSDKFYEILTEEIQNWLNGLVI